MAYLHRFYTVPGGCVSHERVDFAAADFAAITHSVVRRRLVRAHELLREFLRKPAETPTQP